MRSYIALVHKDADSDYGVSFPDLPGCITVGATLDEARMLASEALSFHLEGMAQDGEPVPEPSDLETVMKEAVNRDGVAILVDAPLVQTNNVHVDITLPADLLEQIDARAERDGFTRSGLLAQAARHLVKL